MRPNRILWVFQASAGPERQCAGVPIVLLVSRGSDLDLRVVWASSGFFSSGDLVVLFLCVAGGGLGVELRVRGETAEAGFCGL